MDGIDTQVKPILPELLAVERAKVIDYLKSLRVYYSKQPLTKVDKDAIRGQVDTIIDHCGKLAIKNQPDFKD